MAGPVAVWAVSDGEKIRREQTDHPLRRGNAVWNGRRVRLFAARNEIVAFQLIVTAGEEPVTGLRVSVTPLVHASGATIANRGSQVGWAGERGPGGDLIRPAADPNDYVGRRVELFTQHYLYVPPELSTRPLWYYGPGAPPAQRAGWIPDALIPVHAKAGRGGLPLDVPARSNQGFWVDIFVSPSDELPAGVYRGTVEVSCDGHPAQSIPVELEVLDFDLPDEPTAHDMVFAGAVAPYFPGFEGDVIDAFRKMAHRHRFDLVGHGPHRGRFSEAALAAHRPYLSGE
ncbi:MAG TPA: hypothetical protein VF234_00820, partial [Limnochordia bacterium]